MILTIAAVLFVLWLLGFVAFHITAWVIHLLIVLAIVALIVHIASEHPKPRL
jgi:hypothetical protein